MFFDSLQQVLGVIAGLLGLISYIPYIRGIKRKETIPHRTTFGIWTLIYITSFTSYIAVGAVTTVTFIAAHLIGISIIFVLSFKYGTGGSEKIDIACALGALLGLMLWVLTTNPLFALYFAIFSEFLAFIPTFIKTYRQPYSENLLSWIIGTCGGLLNVFAINELKPEIYIYPIFIFTTEIALILIIVSRRKNLWLNKKCDTDNN